MRSIYKKQKKELKILKRQEKLQKYLYRNKLDKDCFQHDMAYGDGLWL